MRTGRQPASEPQCSVEAGAISHFEFCTYAGWNFGKALK